VVVACSGGEVLSWAAETAGTAQAAARKSAPVMRALAPFIVSS
jgi:hypothetical protein